MTDGDNGELLHVSPVMVTQQSEWIYRDTPLSKPFEEATTGILPSFRRASSLLTSCDFFNESVDALLPGNLSLL